MFNWNAVSCSVTNYDIRGKQNAALGPILHAWGGHRTSEWWFRNYNTFHVSTVQ